MPEIEVDDVPLSGQQVDIEEAIAVVDRPVEPLNPNIIYPKLAKVAANFRGLGFQVVLTPTKMGVEQGLKRFVLVHGLLDWQEANRQAQHLSVQASFLHKDAFKLIHIEPSIIGASEMGNGVNYIFDPTQYEPEQWGGAHPAGNFEAKISNCEIKQNNAQDGANWVVTFDTDSGSISKYYAFWSRNDKAVKGAHNQAAALCLAIGFNQKLDMNTEGKAIIGGRCKIQVGPQANQPEYMEIKKIFDMQGNVPGKANPGASPQQGGGFAGQQPQGPQGGGFQQQGGPQGGFPQQGPQGGGFQPQGQGGQPQGGFQGGGQPQQQFQPQPGQQPQPQGGGWQQQGNQQQFQQPQQPDPNQGGGWQQQQPQQQPQQPQDQSGGWQQQQGGQQAGPSWGQ